MVFDLQLPSVKKLQSIATAGFTCGDTFCCPILGDLISTCSSDTWRHTQQNRIWGLLRSLRIYRSGAPLKRLRQSMLSFSSDSGLATAKNIVRECISSTLTSMQRLREIQTMSTTII